MTQWKEGWGESPNEKKRKQQWKQGWQAKPASAGTSIAGFRQLDQASLKQPVPKYVSPSEGLGSKAKRVAGVGLTGLGVGTLDLIGKGNRLLMPTLPLGEALLKKATGIDAQEEWKKGLQSLSEKGRELSGARGTLGEEIAYGIGKETPAILASYGAVGAASKVPQVARLLTGAGKWTETGRRGVAAGAIYTPIAKDDPTARDYLENMALFGVGDVAAMGLAHGVGKGINALRGRRVNLEEPENLGFLNDIAEPVPRRPADFTVDQFGNARRGTPLKALPEGLPTSPEVRFGDPKGQVHYPSSEFTRNAEYVKSLEGKYKKIVNDEIASMKNEVEGVIRYRPGEDAPLLRASMNPKWYRDFWASNGRAPRAGEMRDMATERLIRGNPETGEPPSEEFLGILSELSRGRKMPEEWHGLTRSMREMEATGEPELRPLIGEMSRRRAGLEPSGLNRNLGKLTDMENSIRRRTRMADEADLGQYGDVRFKSSTDQDLTILRDAMTDRVGPFRIGKVDLAPEAFSKPDFKAAQTIADKLGLRLVAFKGTGHRGMQQGRTIYLNQNMKDPLDYVFWHEVGHTMEVTHPQHYDSLMGIALEHMQDADGLLKHYKDFGYARETMPHEFAADVFAEALHTPGFFARVAEKSPEMLKPLLEAIDSLIANIKAMVSKDDTVLPYLKDLETLRTRIHKEVADPYFRDAMGEKEFVDTFGKQWSDTAAKAKGDSRFKLNQTSPMDDLKSMVEYGAANLRGGRASFEKAIRQQFGDTLQGYSPEVQSRLLNNIWLHSKQLADKGQTTIKMGAESLPVTRGRGGTTIGPIGKQNAAQGQMEGNVFTFPQDATLPKATGRSLTDSPFSGKMSQAAGTEERGVSRNIRTDKARPDELRDAISENPMTYDPLANKETLSKAQAIYADGLEPAVTKLNELLKDMKPEAAPLAKMIADDLTKMGQVDRAREILSNAAVRATEAGQFGQAFRILREADPQSFLMTMDKQLLKMNKQGRELYGKKWKDIDLTEAEKEAIAKLKKGDQQAYDDLMNAIGERIANIMPSTALEKFDSWRRMAMLLNPKTHIRNIGGNIIMMGLRKSADTLAAGLEKTFLKPGQRTKSFGWSKDKNLVDIVNRDWEAISKYFTGEKVTLKNMTKNFPSYGRWDIENMRALNREKRIFKSDLLEKGSNISRNTLSAEDYFFKERAYKDALGGYMKSNNLTEVSDAAREYAKRRALEATYQDANMVATWLNKVKSSGGIGGKLVEAAIPFVKTPTNLVSRAIEYSPAGILRLLSKQNQTPAMAIEILAQGLTGTGVAGLGYQLANMGWIRAERSTSRNAEAIIQEAGDQPYSFITPIGSYTFDWAQPIAVPLFMGVALYESLMKQDKIDPDTVAESIAAGGDTIFNLSMLQNVKQLLGGGFGSVTEQIAGLPVSYIEQAYPTIFGQAARTVDDTKRSTYDTSGTGRFGRQLAAKTPFASKLLEPRLDIWGNEQKQGGVAQQFLNPGYALPKSNDRATQEMVRLYRATKETAFLPKSFKGSFTVNGEQVRLTPKQLTAFQRDMGQANYKEISQAIRTTEYQKASDENKVKIIRKIVQGNYDDTKQGMMDELGIESGKSSKASKSWKAGW